MNSLFSIIPLLLLSQILQQLHAFTVHVPSYSRRASSSCSSSLRITSTSLFNSQDESSPKELSVLLDPQLTEERTKSLFAWISRAFVGDEEYNNLMLAMAAIFGTNLPKNSMLTQLVERGELVKVVDLNHLISGFS